MITDFWFYLAAVPAVFFFGLGKSGIAGVGMLAIPLMAMTTSPVQAAAIVLPLLCVMDLVALYYHRANCNYQELKIMLPLAIVGIVLASSIMGSLSPLWVELFIGCLAILFLLERLVLQSKQQTGKIKGGLLSIFSGFASTIAHAGGPLINMYLLPKALPKAQFIGTLVVFFALVNFIKLIPFTLMGQLNTENLMTSCVLVPVALLGVRSGVWIIERVSQQTIYRFCYTILLITAGKMLYSSSALFL